MSIRKDLYHTVRPVVGMNFTSITGNGTTFGNIINLTGVGALNVVVQAGAITDGTYTILFEEGNDPALADASNVSTENIIPVGTANPAIGFTAAEANTVIRYGYKVGTYKFFRASTIAASVTTGGSIGIVIAQANLDINPL